MMRYFSVVSIFLLLAACDQQSSAPKAVLMVTWLVPGQPPQTSQTEMKDMDACNAARAKAIAAGDDARAERERMNAQDKAEAQADGQRAEEEARATGGVLTQLGPEDMRKLRGEPLPQVSAYCVDK